MTGPLRAVIADDSALYRAVLKRSLLAIGDVEVVAQASNGAEAIEQIRKCSPDLLTLDLNMPTLDGLQTLRAMRDQQLRCEVIVVSSETKQGATTTFEALQLGAVDFITKPAEENAAVSSDVLTQELRRQLAGIRLRRDRVRARREAASIGAIRLGPPAAVAGAAAPTPQSAATLRGTGEVVVIGTSTGGPAALPVLLGGFPSTLRAPILIVQHMPPLFTASLAEALCRKCSLTVVEAHNGQLISGGTVYIAPGGKQMRVKRAFDRSARIVIADEPTENHCKPSVDVLFRSVAQEYGGAVVAALLTGMGNDGVAGMRLLKEAGAVTIAQNEATCTIFGMPQEAIRAGIVDSVLPLDKIAESIIGALRSDVR